MKTLLDYESAIAHGQELLEEQIRDPEGEANLEYARGIVEYICEACGIGMEFKTAIARHLGVKIDDADTFRDVPRDQPSAKTDVDRIIEGEHQ